MVFVTVGSSEFDFKRLLSAIDRLISDDIIKDVVAQIGPSSYEPRFFRYKRFMTQHEMTANIENAEFVICHGGAGTLEECLERRKKVVVMPRRSEYCEAPDDHQLEITQHLSNSGRALVANDASELKQAIIDVRRWEPRFADDRGCNLIVKTINEFIERSLAKR